MNDGKLSNPLSTSSHSAASERYLKLSTESRARVSRGHGSKSKHARTLSLTRATGHAGDYLDDPALAGPRGGRRGRDTWTIIYTLLHSANVIRLRPSELYYIQPYF